MPYQFQDSDICLAALHAGVITNLGTKITITRQEDFTNDLFGTAKNRIVSEDKRLSDESFKVYKVESTEKVEGKFDSGFYKYCLK
ncbi:hypothetical protein E2C01_087868 [Portunus trituberculatus]|uniref:LCCL domain-containing protein n=1 Tax=Portunus trituberculatus TaxID=210409 RepID=A0A5B7J9A2_PORTR|nr:hypothetical protein [Portunus trituberculatus]